VSTATPTSAPTSAPTVTPTTVDPTARVRTRRWLAPVLIVLAVLAGALLVGAVLASGPSGYLRPDAAEPDGGLALHHLLEQQGVRVVVVTDSAQLAPLSQRRRTTVLATSLDELSQADVARVWAADGDIVVTDPTPDAVPELIPGTQAVGTASTGVRDPRCTLPAATRAGSALTGGVAVAGQPLFGRLESCYPDQGGGTVVRQDFPDGHTVAIVGDGTAFTNEHLAEDGNAALALNLLGQQPVVLWLAPNPAAAPAPDGSADLGALLPPWVGIVLAQLVVAVLVAALWRGRRLGPVVVEQLPVRVRAAETTEGRARLYRRRGARARAADHLRAASVARLTGPLGLPVGSAPDAVVAQVVARAGWAPADVASLLYGAAPQDDAGLVRLAGALDSLERQVRDR
jgi:hypothetical protein